MTTGDGKKNAGPAEPPPILKRWRNLYAAVLIYLLALIILFWLFTEHYS